MPKKKYASKPQKPNKYYKTKTKIKFEPDDPKKLPEPLSMKSETL